VLKQPHLISVIRSQARWQWALETDQGTYIAGVAIMPDIDRRGWFVGLPGAALKTGLQLRPLIKLQNRLKSAGVFTELRAWVLADDPQAITFAQRFGFRYDCGPATGFSPTGRDMSLFKWSRT